MKLLKRILGLCETAVPSDEACWEFTGREIRVILNRTPELGRPGGAVRLEGKGLPVRTLVVHGHDGAFHAVANRCTHMGRRIDPLAGTDKIEWCSVSKSTFTYDGQPVGGAAQRPLPVFKTDHRDGELRISID